MPYLFEVFPESGLEKNCDSRFSISDLKLKCTHVEKYLAYQIIVICGYFGSFITSYLKLFISSSIFFISLSNRSLIFPNSVSNTEKSLSFIGTRPVSRLPIPRLAMIIYLVAHANVFLKWQTTSSPLR